MKAEKSKILYLEVLRILSIFFVIFNHTGANGFFLFSAYKSTEIQYWVYLFVSIFCKFSVPMFLAISGALMLGRENESIHRIWTKKSLKCSSY